MCVCVCVCVCASHSGQADLHSNLQFTLTVPVALLDGLCYWWIFVALSGLLQQLEERKQVAKLGLYKQFSNVLVASLVICAVFAAYQIYFVSNNFIEKTWQWQVVWLIDGGFWNLQYTLLLFAILVLWRPSENARRYAYAQQISGDDTDVQLDGFGDEDDGVGHEHAAPDEDLNDGNGYEMSSMNEHATGARPPRATPVDDAAFIIDDDELSGPQVQTMDGDGEDGDGEGDAEVDEQDAAAAAAHASQGHAKRKAKATPKASSATIKYGLSVGEGGHCVVATGDLCVRVYFVRVSTFFIVHFLNRSHVSALIAAVSMPGLHHPSAKPHPPPRPLLCLCRAP